MTSRSIQAILHSLAEAEPAASDAEVLRRFLLGEETAFVELVRRHGRLVWSVCRHLAGSDAEADDAFQASFLVLLRSAGKIRDPGRLSAWLHGVAYKVCAKARQATKRRVTREQACAANERNGAVVADSVWDRALAAVHEEVGKLPEILRIPFVMCCLEGKGVTEAAAQLGWKLGTFSGRLTRAKDALLSRLDARGLTLGAVAALGLATPPASSIAKAAGLVQVGVVVPSSVLQLTQGVIGMSMKSIKLLAAAVMLTCGLGVVAGTGWIAVADAQPPSKAEPEIELRRLQSEVEHARLLAAEKALKQADDAKRAGQLERQREALLAYEALLAAADKGKEEPHAAKTTRWEYDFIAVSDLDQAKFVKFLQDRENRGWEFNGTTPLNLSGKPHDTWVFRRPAKGMQLSGRLGYYPPAEALVVRDGEKLGLQTKLDVAKATDLATLRNLDDATVIEAEIAKLQEKLATLKAKRTVVFKKADLPVPPAELGALLVKLADKKFGKDRVSISTSENSIVVVGDNEVIEWVTGLVKKLADR